MINLELLNESESVELKLDDNSKGGTKNYNELDNKPTINGVELQGDLTTDDLKIIVNAVKDILVNGASIIDKNGNANIPIANENTKFGLTRYHSQFGVYAGSDGYARVITASEKSIKERGIHPYSIAPSNYDYAVKCAMTDGKGAEWTSEEKANARERIGLGWKLLGDITVEEDGVTMIECPIDNPNYNEYQFFIVLADRTDTTNKSMMVNFDSLSTNTYALAAFGVGTNKNYSGRGYAQRHCNSGWLTFALGGVGNSQNATMTTNAGRANNYSKGATWNTESPTAINVSLATGLDIGSRFVVYAR